jgi:hypothetical protein
MRSACRLSVGVASHETPLGRARTAAMRGSCYTIDPPAGRAELGDMRGRSPLRTLAHAEMRTLPRIFMQLSSCSFPI